MNGTDRSDARLSDALRPFLAGIDGRPRAVLLAVSGGPDSTALLLAAATFPGRPPLYVATVDHRLRPDSAGEASAVAALTAGLDLPHATLIWEAPHEGAGLQAAARAARYRLLQAHALGLGATLILTAHTADDQAETVLMRLIAGSGPAGLAGMRPRRALGEGVTLGRPFLALTKADLVAHCEVYRLPFATDPSNFDDRFGRVRLRKLLPLLAEGGLTADRLCTLAERAARDDVALSRFAADCLGGALLTAEDGAVALDPARLDGAPDAVLIRVIDAAIRSVADVSQPLVAGRLRRLERLVLEELRPALRARLSLRRTLRGVLIEVSNDRVVLRPAPLRGGRSSAAPGPTVATGFTWQG